MFQLTADEIRDEIYGVLIENEHGNDKVVAKYCAIALIVAEGRKELEK